MTSPFTVGCRFEYLTNGGGGGGQLRRRKSGRVFSRGCPGRARPFVSIADPPPAEMAGVGPPVLERTTDMAKFIYLYRGPAPDMSDLTPEQVAERTAAFGAWMEKAGPALVDVGSPFGSNASVRDDGTEGTAGDLIGYTIVDADDLAAAKALTDGLPFLAGQGGSCAVEIFELLPM
jgi:hypothetical protein